MEEISWSYTPTWYKDLLAANGGKEPENDGILSSPYSFAANKPLRAYMVPYGVVAKLVDTFNPDNDVSRLFVIQAEFPDVFVTRFPGYTALLTVGDDAGLARFKEALIKVDPGYEEQCPF